jgi:hypothetical protein
MAHNRKSLRKEYKITSNYFVDLLRYCLPVYPCAVAQEYREVILRKSKREDSKTKTDLPVFVFQAPEGLASKSQEDEDDYLESCNASSECIREGTRLVIAKFKSKVLDFGEGNTSLKDSDEVSSFRSPSSREATPRISREPSIILSPPVEVGVYPLDGTDPRIYSLRVNGPFTYVPGKPFDSACPPPTYMPMAKLLEPKPTLSTEILYGLTLQSNGSLKCTDQDALDKQKGVVGEVLKQITKSITSGLGAVGVSLPIRIFEPRSTIERMMDRFSFAPVFLKQAAQSTDQFDRFLSVIAFGVSGLYMAAKQSKPFNPLLGETFQGNFPDGTQVFAEHVSHHPPVDSFFILAANYVIFGFTELEGAIKFNSLLGSFKGPTTVKFHDGQSVIFHQPKFRLEGMLWGDRTLAWEGEFKFEDPKNNWVAILHIGADPRGYNPLKLKVKKDTILGKVYVPEGNRLDKIRTELATLHGSWVKELIVVKSGVERKLWEMDREMPVRHLPAADSLPSDWRYREDLIWLSRDNTDIAQKWKTTLETRQRDDRELRKRKR